MQLITPDDAVLSPLILTVLGDARAKPYHRATRSENWTGWYRTHSTLTTPRISSFLMRNFICLNLKMWGGSHFQHMVTSYLMEIIRGNPDFTSAIGLIGNFLNFRSTP